MSYMPVRCFGNSVPGVFALGIGTTWFGRPWPPDNSDYAYPSFREISDYLDAAYRAISAQSGLLMVDTAASYGYSEELLGKYFSERREFRARTILATKWGEEFDLSTGRATLDHSRSHLVSSLQRSMERLQKIDVLYIHRSSVEALMDKEIVNAMVEASRSSNIRYVGASFSDEETLDAAVKRDLLSWADVVQFPATYFMTRGDLVDAVRRKSISIILNSPVRRGGARAPEEIYAQLAGSEGFSAVLTGTRHHLGETITYF